MPYKDPAHKREWDRIHRPDRAEAYFRSVSLKRLYEAEFRADPEDRSPEGDAVTRYDFATIPENEMESVRQVKRRLNLP